MSEWIIDRRPTDDDAYYITSTEGIVWVTDGNDVIKLYHEVDGMPWMPIESPEPYVKAKRWEVIWDGYNNCWKVRDRTFEFGGMLCNCLRTQEHREAAERIAAIYEEVMP